MKKMMLLLPALVLVLAFAACANGPGTPVEETPVEQPAHEPATIMVAAAASLENAFAGELIPLFRSKYEWITVEGTYDSSGKLQTQIEEGLTADVFVSAATKQMDALVASEHIRAGSVVPLLENKVVLIEPAAASSGITGFEQAAEFAGDIAIGDPDSVPAGQYAEEIFTNLGIWEQVLARASLGTNVTEVLSWVAAGSAGLGVVYATDAAGKADEVTVITEAPADSMAQPVTYPLGILARTEREEATQLFYEFLQSDEAAAIFRNYGFTPIR